MNENEPTIGEVLSAINQLSSDIEQRFDEFDQRFDSLDGRLDGIERALWHGEKLYLIEDRIRKLAERTGNADLAVAIMPPPGEG